MSGLFNFARGVAQGAKNVSTDYLLEQRRQDDFLKQIALGNRAIALDLNDGESFDAANKTLGIDMPGVGERLAERHASAQRKGALEEQSMQTSIDSAQHGMAMADKTFDFNKQQHQDGLKQWQQQYGLQLKDLEEKVRQFNASNRLGWAEHDTRRMLGLGQLSVDKQRLGLQQQELGLSRERLNRETNQYEPVQLEDGTIGAFSRRSGGVNPTPYKARQKENDPTAIEDKISRIVSRDIPFSKVEEQAGIEDPKLAVKREQYRAQLRAKFSGTDDDAAFDAWVKGKLGGQQ